MQDQNAICTLHFHLTRSFQYYILMVTYQVVAIYQTKTLLLPRTNSLLDELSSHDTEEI